MPEQTLWLTALDLYMAYKDPYKNFTKNKNIEQFYSYCYTNIIMNANTYLSDINPHTATLLLCKVTDQLLYHSKDITTKNELPELEQLLLSEKEEHGLKYIGGYILEKLYKTFKNSSSWQSTESQQTISLLRAGKED